MPNHCVIHISSNACEVFYQNIPELMKNSKFTTNFKEFTSLTMGYRNNTISKVFHMQKWGPGSGQLPNTIADCTSNCSTVCMHREDRRIVEACCLPKSVSPNSRRHPVSRSKVGHSQERHSMSTSDLYIYINTHTNHSCIETPAITHTLTNKLKNKSPHMFSNYSGTKLQINKWSKISTSLFNR